MSGVMSAMKKKKKNCLRDIESVRDSMEVREGVKW